MLLSDDGGPRRRRNLAAGDLHGMSREQLIGRCVTEFAGAGYDCETARLPPGLQLSVLPAIGDEIAVEKALRNEARFRALIERPSTSRISPSTA